MSILKQIDKKMGFGLYVLNKWYHFSILGAFLVGTGLGIYLSSENIFQRCQYTLAVTVIGVTIFLVGAVISEISIRKLIKIHKHNNKII